MGYMRRCIELKRKGDAAGMSNEKKEKADVVCRGMKRLTKNYGQTIRRATINYDFNCVVSSLEYRV